MKIIYFKKIKGGCFANKESPGDVLLMPYTGSRAGVAKGGLHRKTSCYLSMAGAGTALAERKGLWGDAAA